MQEETNREGDRLKIYIFSFPSHLDYRNFSHRRSCIYQKIFVSDFIRESPSYLVRGNLKTRSYGSNCYLYWVSFVFLTKYSKLSAYDIILYNCKFCYNFFSWKDCKIRDQFCRYIYTCYHIWGWCSFERVIHSSTSLLFQRDDREESI